MQPSEREIEQALQSAARIIHRYGEAYWPLFERLETELTTKRSRRARLQAYIDGPVLAPFTRTNPPEKDARSSKVHRA